MAEKLRKASHWSLVDIASTAAVSSARALSRRSLRSSVVYVFRVVAMIAFLFDLTGRSAAPYGRGCCVTGQSLVFVFDIVKGPDDREGFGAILFKSSREGCDQELCDVTEYLAGLVGEVAF